MLPLVWRISLNFSRTTMTGPVDVNDGGDSAWQNVPIKVESSTTGPSYKDRKMSVQFSLSFKNSDQNLDIKVIVVRIFASEMIDTI